MLPSGHNMAVGPINSQHQWLPAQDWAHKNFILGGRGMSETAPLPE